MGFGYKKGESLEKRLGELENPFARFMGRAGFDWEKVGAGRRGHAQTVFAVAYLAWERDLRNWEKLAVLDLLDGEDLAEAMLSDNDCRGSRLAVDFILCGISSFGFEKRTAGLREMMRYACLEPAFGGRAAENNAKRAQMEFEAWEASGGKKPGLLKSSGNFAHFARLGLSALVKHSVSVRTGPKQKWMVRAALLLSAGAVAGPCAAGAAGISALGAGASLAAGAAPGAAAAFGLGASVLGGGVLAKVGEAVGEIEKVAGWNEIEFYSRMALAGGLENRAASCEFGALWGSGQKDAWIGKRVPDLRGVGHFELLEAYPQMEEFAARLERQGKLDEAALAEALAQIDEWALKGSSRMEPGAGAAAGQGSDGAKASRLRSL